jgi:predicted phage terminase large subunit-like protein
MSDRPFLLNYSIPKHDKATRLMSQTSEIEAGRVYLPKNAEWLEEFRRELLNFPNGVHDDQVDSLTLFLKWDESRYRYRNRSRVTIV